MNGDFSRLTFDRNKHYSSVRWQQGRVQLDADFNEQVDIAAHRVETGTADLIGVSGAPFRGEAAPANFQIHVEKVSRFLRIAPGHIYVDGLLCENDGNRGEVFVFRQTELPPSPPAVVARDDTTVAESAIAANTTYLVYLDAWQRHLSALDDDSLLETALGGPDTTTRTKTVWQVKLLPFAGTDATCSEALWEKTAGRSSGGLAATFERETSSFGPCDPPTADVARRGENQLYRIEVHKKGGLGEATFKWSRDNGTVVAAIDTTKWNTPGTLPLKTNGRDDAHRFARDNWAELTDDTHELRGLPGLFVHITGADGSPVKLTIDPPKDDDGQVVALDQLPAIFTNNPKLRRWDTLDDDGSKQVGTRTLRRNAADNEYLPIENGLKVLFGKVSESPPAAADPRFQTGDYWLIPIRSREPELRWPSDTQDHALSVKPHGVDHHFCPLAIVKTDAAGKFEDPSDCRPLFPAVTDLANLRYVSGDGRTTTADGKHPLRLQAAVANGRWPVIGAKIRFTVVTSPTGTPTWQLGLSADALGEPGKLLDPVPTAERGVATVYWQPDADPNLTDQYVEARLLDDQQKEVGSPVRFNGGLARATGRDIGVSRVTWFKGEENAPDDLSRGEPITPENLARGLTVDFEPSADGDTSPIDEAVCFVTIDLPTQSNGMVSDRLVVNAMVTPDAKSWRINWKPDDGFALALENLLINRFDRQRWPVLASLHVVGGSFATAGRASFVRAFQLEFQITRFRLRIDPSVVVAGNGALGVIDAMEETANQLTFTLPDELEHGLITISPQEVNISGGSIESDVFNVNTQAHGSTRRRFAIEARSGDVGVTTWLTLDPP